METIRLNFEHVYQCYEAFNFAMRYFQIKYCKSEDLEKLKKWCEGVSPLLRKRTRTVHDKKQCEISAVICRENRILDEVNRHVDILKKNCINIYYFMERIHIKIDLTLMAPRISMISVINSVHLHRQLWWRKKINTWWATLLWIIVTTRTFRLKLIALVFIFQELNNKYTACIHNRMIDWVKFIRSACLTDCLVLNSTILYIFFAVLQSEKKIKSLG